MKNVIDGILVLLVLFSIYTDLKERRILNMAIIPALVAGIAINTYLKGTEGLFFSLQGTGLGLLLLLIPFAMGGFGAGDVKLLAAIGALKGPGFVVVTFMGMGIAGGILAVLVLIKQGRLTATAKRLTTSAVLLAGSSGRVNPLKSLDQAEYSESVPYAVAIGIGTLLAYLVR